jgi:hypothetical protein
MTPSPPSVIINEVEMARRARRRKVRLNDLYPFLPSLAALHLDTLSSPQTENGSFAHHFLPPSVPLSINFLAMVVLAPLLHLPLGDRRVK